jgi:hypothetical protein
MRFRKAPLLVLGAVGPVCWALAACSGSSFTGKSSPRDTEDDLQAQGASGEGGRAAGGPDQPREREPQPAADPANGTAGDYGGSGSGSGGSGSGGSGSGGSGSGTPTGSGVAGEPSPPEVPPDTGCGSPVHDTWEAPLGTSHSGWVVEFGDPRVDLASERLIVSYDDVAARKAPLVGGYYLTAEVTFEGATVLTPYPYVSGVLLPSLRRNASGDGVQLGSTQYGLGNAWHSDLPAGFAGKTLSDTNKVLVTTYIQASNRALAVKVQSGDQTYRSGWITGFTWPETDLGVFRYVGENNSSVYGGASDVVYVGAIDGCQALSDAAVAAHYDD